MNSSTSDVIRKQVRLNASRSRVWRAISDAREFGEWFLLKLDGEFREGETIRGAVTAEGYEHLKFEAVVEKMEPERLFSMRWVPHAMDPEKDYSGEPTTLVEFVLEDVVGGTLLTLTESGFDGIPEEVRGESFLRNEEGWGIQMVHIRRYVDG